MNIGEEPFLKMTVAREKLTQTKYKISLAIWIAFWCVTAYIFFSHSGVVLGLTDEEGIKPAWIWTYIGVIAAMGFSAYFCFYRWATVYTPKTPENGKFRPRIKWYDFIWLILTDVFCFFVMEMINNHEKLAEMKPLYIGMNLLGGLIMGLIMFFFYNSLKRACFTLLCLTITMSLIFYFVYAVKGEPLQLIDIFNFSTAMEVAGGYEFVFTRWVTVFLVLSLCLIAVINHCPDRTLAKKTKSRILMRVGIVAFMVFGYWFYLYTNWNVKLGIVTDLWAPHDTYEECGTNLGFFCVAKFMKNDPPQGYSVRKVEEIAEESEKEYEQWDGKPEAKAVKPVNIIAIMNESWADYRHANPELKTNVPYMEYYDSMCENVIKGHTAVCIWGGGTSKSEYEFLTGNSVLQYPGLVPYVNFYTHDQYSMVSTLKAQGYEAVAMHPNKGTNWNRITAYNYLGFDRFITIDDFDEDAEKHRGMISDLENYKKIIEVVNSKENADDPLFLFDITMQNHGGYTANNYKSDVFVEGFEDDAANRFLSLQKNTDEATEYLIEYFKTVDEPTMIIMFGDHYPGLEELEKFLSGDSHENLSSEEEELYFETPFFIWTNYESDTKTDVLTSCNFLGTIVLSETGLLQTPYNHYLQMFMSDTIAYNHIGYYDSDRVFHSWDEAPEEMLNKRTEYEYLQYNSLMESINRVDWFFTLEGD